METAYRTGRVLAYRIPSGWFEAAIDSGHNARHLWLIRGDYAASITIDEIRLDEPARRMIGRGDLSSLAILAASLDSGGGARVNQMEFSFGDRKYMTFEQVILRDTVRVAVFDTGTRVFQVSAIVREGETEGAKSEVFSAQQALLKSLRW